jgi:hypothetical protein
LLRKTKILLEINDIIGYNTGMARSFAKRMEAVGDVLFFNVSKTIRRAGMAATNEVVLRTPVKTGRARINWRVGLGTFTTKEIEAPDTDNRNTNAQVAAAQALINASNTLKNWKVGKGNIYIANPIHYITDLDEGSSRQARAGMTKFAIAAARDVLRTGRLLRG